VAKSIELWRAVLPADEQARNPDGVSIKVATRLRLVALGKAVQHVRVGTLITERPPPQIQRDDD